MKKSVLSVLAIIILSFSCLCGCGENFPDEIKFVEFPQFGNFNENITKIEVAWNSCGLKTVRFSINEEDEIKTIIKMYKETTFIKLDDGFDGGYIYLTTANNTAG